MPITLISLFSVLLLVCCPCIGGKLQQASAGTHAVVFEVSTEYWDVYSHNDCAKLVEFRLYEDGSAEYDLCDQNGKNVTLERKKIVLDKEDIDGLLNLVNQPGFLEAAPQYHSGFRGDDAGWNTMLLYNEMNQAKRVVIRNYFPDSKGIPRSIHEMLSRAFALRQKSEALRPIR